MKVIIGLGNPGKKYLLTRHNVGFLLLDECAKKYNLKFKPQLKFNAETCEVNIKNNKVLLVKPLTFMNLSGDCVAKIMNFYKGDINDVLVLVDDINIPFSTIRLRLKGSSGGHNGLKDIEKKLKTDTFNRLRIGVGGNGDTNLVNYVLGDFLKSELKILKEETFMNCLNIIDLFAEGISFSDIMTKYN